MRNRKTLYGWMTLGGLLCLFGIVLACRLRDGNRAVAHDDVSATNPAIPVVPLPGDGDAKAEEKKFEAPKGQEPVPLAGPGPVEDKSQLPAMTPQAGFAPAPSPPVNPPSGLVPAHPPVAEKVRDALNRLVPPTSPAPPVGMTPMNPAAPPQPPMPQLGGPTPESAPQSVPTPPAPAPASALAPAQGLPPAPNPPQPTQPTLTPPVPPVAPPQHTEQARRPDPSPVRAEPAHSEPGEPPLAPAPGPVQMYQVRYNAETLQDIARKTLGDGARWVDIHKLNPNLRPDAALAAGSVVRLPADACVPAEEVEAVKPLPNLHPHQTASKPKVVMPLTGTYPCNLDDKKTVVLPKAIRDQFGNCDTVLLSPGPDHCLWVTNQTHLERLAKRLESAPVQEHVVRDFRRLYFAQTEKAAVGADGRVAVPDKLIQFAGLHQEVVLVGIDDHFELWDVARWRQYTQQKSAAARSAMAEE
jgi:MraZ protein